MFCFYLFFFFKQKTAYEMRISDWSSDVCSSDLRRKPSAFFLELHRTQGKLLCLFGGEAGTPRGNGSGNLFQAVLAHGLGEDGIGFLQRIDPVDQVNVEFAHVHREFANAVAQRSVDARPVAGTVIAKGNLLCLRSDEHPSALQSLMR